VELLDDLRPDEGMGFVPTEMWLTYLAIDAPASTVSYDLAIEADGADCRRWWTRADASAVANVRRHPTTDGAARPRRLWNRDANGGASSPDGLLAQVGKGSLGCPEATHPVHPGAGRR